MQRYWIYKFFAYFYSSNPFPPVHLKHQVSTLFTRELSSRDSWTQTPNSNFLMLGSDFLGSVRPLKFKQYYLQHCEKTPPTNRCTSQGTASATSWDPHSSTPTAFLQAASLKIISFKAMFSARHLPFPRLPGKFQPCCPSIPYIRLVLVAQCEPIKTNKLKERCPCLLLFFHSTLALSIWS